MKAEYRPRSSCENQLHLDIGYTEQKAEVKKQDRSIKSRGGEGTFERLCSKGVMLRVPGPDCLVWMLELPVIAGDLQQGS